MNAQIIKLQPNEKILTGRWQVADGRARADAICDRIDWLIAHHLQKVADNPQSGAWETLYRDPDADRYWERTYPQGEMHGGGPPQLQRLTFQEARKKYGDSVLAA
jgi:immunity protein 27 of polymorphic toxin system